MRIHPLHLFYPLDIPYPSLLSPLSLSLSLVSVFLNFIGSHYDRAKARGALLIVVSVLQ
jgi:hypothetical protein